MPNALQHEKSLYLLQHANNPVNWLPWGKASLEKAKSSNKLILVSIGYSSCHWCHVMEHECFEDQAVAELMNKHFINIKVDREELPDVDQYYMRAMQLMTKQGGWPLNCICLPDGRPIWSSTYLPKERWTAALLQLQGIFEENPEQMEDYAQKVEEGIAQSEIIEDSTEEFSKAEIFSTVELWKKSFDLEHGGYKRTPKFPLPNSWNTLLNYSFYYNDNPAKEHCKNTCLSLVQKGIFDHINGGWFRYSTDEKWHIPHFEKMLYDNAQLLSLIAKAYTAYKLDVFKESALKTLAFLKKEFRLENGLYQAALDADTEGEEGKYYLFTLEELKQAAGDDFKALSKIYGIDKSNTWEGKYHIHEFASDVIIDPSRKQKFLDNLHEIQSKRKKPYADNKCLLSWNALLLSALCEVYKIEQSESVLNDCKKLFEALEQFEKEEHLQHAIIEGEQLGLAYADDIAFYAEACVNYFCITGSKKAYAKCLELCCYQLDDFTGKQAGMYKFQHSDSLIKQAFYERQDNVVNSVNSTLASVFLKMAALFALPMEHLTSVNMVRTMKPEIKRHPSAYINWLNVAMEQAELQERVYVGKDAFKVLKKEWLDFYPLTVSCYSNAESDLYPFKNKYKEGETWFYNCRFGDCNVPKMINFSE